MPVPATRLLRYAVVGSLTLAVYLAVGHVVRRLELPLPWQASLAFMAAVTFNYLLQRAWVFEDARPARSSLPKYAVMITVGYMINLAALTAFAPRMPLLLAQLTAVILVVAWNAALSFSWVFLAGSRNAKSMK
jgi:putative flippase GtrA